MLFLFLLLLEQTCPLIVLYSQGWKSGRPLSMCGIHFKAFPTKAKINFLLQMVPVACLLCQFILSLSEWRSLIHLLSVVFIFSIISLILLLLQLIFSNSFFIFSLLLLWYHKWTWISSWIALVLLCGYQSLKYAICSLSIRRHREQSLQ